MLCARILLDLRQLEGVESPEGASPMMQTVKVPVDVPTFRCRRYVPAAWSLQSRYETLDFTEGELEIVRQTETTTAQVL